MAGISPRGSRHAFACPRLLFTLLFWAYLAFAGPISQPDTADPVEIAPGQSANPTSLKIMVVGDSISHGESGDWTWRYRIWQWFRNYTDIDVKFVGPFVGTNPSPPPIVPEGESDPCPCDWGLYDKDADPEFTNGNSNHYAVWGRQLAQVFPHIENVTAVYQPDLILTLMGFNDMVWYISDADGLVDSVQHFVKNARKAKPDLHFAIADVAQRSLIGGRMDIVTNTFRYRHMLPSVLAELATPESPVKFVELSEVYDCEPAYCPASYGGLHPNALGEYQIAHAFSRTLHDSYGYGTGYLEIPAWNEIPLRNVAVPDNLKVESPEPGLIDLTWDVVLGANGYGIRYRIAGDEDWSHPWRASDQPWYHHTNLKSGTTWEFKIRSEYGTTEQGGRYGNWSEIMSAVVL